MLGTMNTAVIHSPVAVEARKNIGIKAGDTVRVMQKIQEKGKTRLQAFEGIVLSVKHGTEAGATFTVRKVASGVGTEKTFPLYSPLIDKIEIVKRAKVRRAKLYYIREKAAKEIRRAMRNSRMMNLTTDVPEEKKEEETPEAADADTPAVEETPAAPEAEETTEDTPAPAEDEKAEETAETPEPPKEDSPEEEKKD